ncbi:guanylate-binding protein 6 isoform X2 [Nematostella vectensis]|nr:guanylate-binding protein 6 isoform X2 [Nematostella vectensis]
MDPETMGIWLYVVDQKFKDANGREVTVVLLDSEGINATGAQKSDDHSVFTLSVLLSSVMIYNSAGVPTRTDLEDLDYIVKLSQRVQLRTGHTIAEDAALLHKTFPFFIWLLRDVVLKLPTGCSTIRDYFIKKVLNAEERGPAKAQKAAESILKFFPGFDAFKLPPPSDDPDIIQRINEEAVQDKLSPRFLEGVEQFKNILHPRLVAKTSFNEGELVSGEALSALVQLYTESLNTPGTVPNVQSAWDTFIQTKCTEVMEAAKRLYKKEMTSRMEGKLPCDNDVIRQAHLDALDDSLTMFRTETYGLSAHSVENFLNQLTEQANDVMAGFLEENKHLTEKLCQHLVVELKESKLDPVLARLRGPQGHQLKFAEIIAAFSAIEQEYRTRARGAKDVCASVFFAYHPHLQKEMEQHMEQLQALKDYDERLTQEQAEKAAMEDHRQRLEEEKNRLEDEKRVKEREFALMIEKQEEDKMRLQEQFEENMRNQREQMVNMMEANQEELRREREVITQQNRNLENVMESMREMMGKRDEEMSRIMERMVEIANRPTPPPPKGGSCIIL